MWAEINGQIKVKSKMTVNYALCLARSILNVFVTDLTASWVCIYIYMYIYFFFSGICHVGMFSSVWLF